MTSLRNRLSSLPVLILLASISAFAQKPELVVQTGHSQNVQSVAFSPDGKTLVSGGSDHMIKLWEADTGRELRTLTGHTEVVNSVAFSPGGKLIISASDDKTVKLWNVESGKEVKTLTGHFSQVSSVAFSPDGKRIVTASNDGTIKLWDAETVREIKTLAGHASSVQSIAFSPDGKLIVTGSFDHSIKLWDAETGQELLTLAAPYDRDSYVQLAYGAVESVAFSPDGKQIASGSDDTVRLWNAGTGKEIRTLGGHSSKVSSVAFSPDGRRIVSGSHDNTIKLWDAETGREIKSLVGHSGAVNSVAFSPDGKRIVTAGDDSSIKLWDAETGEVAGTLIGHTNYVSSVAFSADGKFLVSGSEDATARLWRADNGELQANLIALDEHDWIAVTPDGLFDGSPASWNKIIWRFNNNTFNNAPVEAFFSDFYHPGLLTDILARKRPKAPSDISQKDRRQPQLNLTLADERPAEIRITARNVTIRVELTKAPAGAQDVRLFRNGSLVRVWRGDVLKGKPSGMLEATIPIVAGENRLTAYAFNRDNVKSADASLKLTGADSLQRKGTAYVLAVGVNVYANPQYNLKYAVADARSFGQEVKLQQEKLDRYGRVEVTTLYDEEATKAKILQRLKQLAATAQPEDTVLFYFAGHGTAARDRFYLIPHDLSYTGSRKQIDRAGIRTILAHSISDRELEQVFEGIDAGHILFVLDACNSGQALEAEERRRGPMNSKGLAQLAYEKGMYILTASESFQFANEEARLGHGFLTYALVEEGLKSPAADQEPQDGVVVVREWLNYALERVPQIHKEQMERKSAEERARLRSRKVRDLGLSTVEDVQQPRVFYRRELEAQPLIVAKPGATPPQK